MPAQRRLHYQHDEQLAVAPKMPPPEALIGIALNTVCPARTEAAHPSGPPARPVTLLTNHVERYR